MTGELDLVRGLTESLRAQNHEAANRLHTIVSLVEMGRAEQAVAFATAELQVAQGLADQVVGAVDEPVLAALLLGKTAQAAERGIELESPATSSRRAPRRPRDLVTLVGNLVDNAFDAVAETAGAASRVRVTGDADTLTSRWTTRVPASAPRTGPRPRARLVEQGPGGSRARAGDGRPGRLAGTAARSTSPPPPSAVRASWSAHGLAPGGPR